MVQEIKSILGLTSADYDVIIIIFAGIIVLYLLNSISRVIFSIFKGD